MADGDERDAETREGMVLRGVPTSPSSAAMCEAPSPTARAAAGEKNLVVTGRQVARRCIDEGLVDEVLIHLAPVLLGSGVRLFEALDMGPAKLERLSVAQSGQLDLRCRVVDR